MIVTWLVLVAPLTAMDNLRPDAMTRTCGTLTITVRYDGVADAGPLGLRHRWMYRIRKTARPNQVPAVDVDLYPAQRSPADTRQALAWLVTVLAVAGQAYSSATPSLTSCPVSATRFADWVLTSAHQNVPELMNLALALTSTDHSPQNTIGPGQRS